MWHKTKLPEYTTSIQQEGWRQRLNVSLLSCHYSHARLWSTFIWNTAVMVFESSRFLFTSTDKFWNHLSFIFAERNRPIENLNIRQDRWALIWDGAEELLHQQFPPEWGHLSDKCHPVGPRDQSTRLRQRLWDGRWTRRSLKLLPQMQVWISMVQAPQVAWRQQDCASCRFDLCIDAGLEAALW